MKKQLAKINFNIYNKKNMKKQKLSDIIIYQALNGAIELKGDFDKETVWANRMQMAEMFGVNPQAISKHIQYLS